MHQRRPLTAKETARCLRCSAVLYRGNPLKIDHWLALTITAAILFIIANSYPVIRIGFQGLHNETTLWQSAAALAQGAAAPIAVPTALAIILVPFMQISLLLWVLIYARLNRKAPGFSMAMKMLMALRPWSMVEVALLGILIAIIKLSSFLQVAPGLGIWATIGLMILIPLIASKDSHFLWDIAESDTSNQNKGSL